jgi:hypothetical protein
MEYSLDLSVLQYYSSFAADLKKRYLDISEQNDSILIRGTFCYEMYLDNIC